MKNTVLKSDNGISVKYVFSEMPENAEGWELLEAAGRKRGFLVSGGEVNLERMAKVLLEEYRSCKLGRFTLETPEMLEVSEDVD